jgi:hypothetical protein
MVDTTLNAPGTTNNPWLPAGFVFPVSGIQSDATGFRCVNSPPGTNGNFADNQNYGSTITATCTIAAGATSGSDDILIGAMVRSGGNAGGIIGLRVQSTGVNVLTSTGAGVFTGISTLVAHTRATSDVFSCTVTVSGGTATVNASINGGGNLTFSANTTTTFATESSLAAGGQFSPQNTNSLYLSQFTGTGISGGGDIFLGQAFM